MIYYRITFSEILLHLSLILQIQSKFEYDSCIRNNNNASKSLKGVQMPSTNCFRNDSASNEFYTTLFVRQYRAKCEKLNTNLKNLTQQWQADNICNWLPFSYFGNFSRFVLVREFSKL